MCLDRLNLLEMHVLGQTKSVGNACLDRLNLRKCMLKTVKTPREEVEWHGNMLLVGMELGGFSSKCVGRGGG